MDDNSAYTDLTPAFFDARRMLLSSLAGWLMVNQPDPDIVRAEIDATMNAMMQIVELNYGS